MTHLNSYAEVQAYLRAVFTGDLAPDGSNAEENATLLAPHGSFWTTMSYEAFTSGNVPGVDDPTTGDPMPILIKGDSAHSNIVMALRGTPGSAFGPNGAIGRMPAGGVGFLTDDQMQPFLEWIDHGCPE